MVYTPLFQALKARYVEVPMITKGFMQAKVIVAQLPLSAAIALHVQSLPLKLIWFNMILFVTEKTY